MSVRVFSREMTIEETIIGWQLSAANIPSYCFLQTSVTSKFTNEKLLVTDVCQQQIHQLFISDRRLSCPYVSKGLFSRNDY